MSDQAAPAPRRGRLIRALRNPAWVARVFEGRLREARVRFARHRFHEGCARIFSQMRRPPDAATVVLFCHSGFLRFEGLHALLGRRLAERGALPVYLLAPFPPVPLDDPALRALEGSITRYSRTLYLRAGQDPADAALAHAWEIDLAAGVCRAEGIDFGPALVGGLRRDLKRYILDLGDPTCQSEATELLRSADATLTVCLALRALAQRGRRVLVVGAELLYVPAGILNIFSRQPGSGIEFVDFADTYAHYYSGGPLSWHHLGIQNITRHGLDTHMDVRREDFEAWLATAPDAAAALSEAARVTQHNRTAASPPPEAQALLQRIAERRRSGGKVVAVFGHITFDLGGLQDRGPAHEDMVDWLNHTLALLGRTSHLVLLKPHPEEGRYKGNRRPCQLLAELLQGPLPANVVLLDPLWFNAHELIPHLDAGVVWRSTVAIELALAGVPVLVAGREAYYRRCLDLPYPENREHYAELLARIVELRISEAQRQRIALFLGYVPQQTFLDLPYVEGAWGGSRGPEAWIRPALTRVLEQGDPALDRACDVLLA